MSATKKLVKGVYQVNGTDWAIRNDSRQAWWVCKVVDGVYSLEPKQTLFVQGTRSAAIRYAKELHTNS